ncbi:hypothetical protein M408DRAFT_112444 [Serendipita vermifera MAFF 305830]|uniref:Carboxypeptidase n=1 Tax=Serendipita vermifera MAFF 305830 TaxID=933852 RepID=A0A0C2WTB2_SERVB|nr:hypothetical protein M408DRAFT_112444 [Serendipita vermifera MAFF 305830]
MWAGHLLAEPTNQIPPGPDRPLPPNLEIQSHLYFVLIKARRASDRERTIWWFNGGPGCSSFDGLMMEVGPWRMNENGELREIEGGWEEYANIVYIDQPVGTGFSYGSTDKYIKELKDVPKQVLEFMRNFYAIFPELASTDTYLAGESYAGQYIPYIADALLKPDAYVPAPLKGIAIGNGWIDSRNQYPAYREFALRAGLFTAGSPEDEYAKEQMELCQAELDTPGHGSGGEHEEPPSTPACEEVMGSVLRSFTKDVDGTKMCMNVYDIRLTDTWPACGMTWPPDLAQVTPWLRKSSVVNALHATHKDSAWQECSGAVGHKMKNKHSEASIKLLPGVADKIPVMLFAGDQDVICNYVGQEMLLAKMKWRGAVGMQGAETLAWTVNGTAAGTWQTARNLTYAKIYQASHMVGFDLPHVAHDMMLRFMGVDFSRIREGTAAKIESSVGENKHTGGDSKLSEVEQAAKWQAYYNAGTVALIVVLIAVFIGTFLYCRFRRNSPTRNGYANGGARETAMPTGDEDESIPLNPSRVANGEESIEESRRRKGKGRATPQPEETMFEIGSDGEEKYPS